MPSPQTAFAKARKRTRRKKKCLRETNERREPGNGNYSHFGSLEDEKAAETRPPAIPIRRGSHNMEISEHRSLLIDRCSRELAINELAVFIRFIRCFRFPFQNNSTRFENNSDSTNSPPRVRSFITSRVGFMTREGFSH